MHGILSSSTISAHQEATNLQDVLMVDLEKSCVLCHGSGVGDRFRLGQSVNQYYNNKQFWLFFNYDDVHVDAVSI